MLAEPATPAVFGVAGPSRWSKRTRNPAAAADDDGDERRKRLAVTLVAANLQGLSLSQASLATPASCTALSLWTSPPALDAVPELEEEEAAMVDDEGGGGSRKQALHQQHFPPTLRLTVALPEPPLALRGSPQAPHERALIVWQPPPGARVLPGELPCASPLLQRLPSAYGAAERGADGDDGAPPAAARRRDGNGEAADAMEVEV